MDQVLGLVPPFRTGTKVGRSKMAFVFNAGGIGDYINWITPIRYAIESNPHIYGYIVTPPYFEDLARLWLSSYGDRFELKVSPKFEDEPYLDDIPCVAPNRSQYANAGGFHLFSLGFTLYNQISYVPKGYELIPNVRGDEADVSRFELPRDYAVIPTNATADNRRLPARVINEITEAIVKRGITPVFLGKVGVAADLDYVARANDGIRTRGSIDLREKTNLVEAAVIMDGARFVLGMDSGLLHLASCTKTSCVWIFTSVDPKYRVPPRREGAVNVIIAPPPDLGCRFCQTSMRFVFGHDFKNCLYKDNACVESIKGSDVIKILNQTVMK